VSLIVVAKEFRAVCGKTGPRRSGVDKHLKHLHPARRGIDDIDEQDRQIAQAGV
jgi:hypothetical protein